MQEAISANDFYLMTKINRIIIPFFAFLCGIILTGIFDPVLVILAFVAIIFTYAGAATLNDIFDLNIDRISSPERPIPSNKIGASGAIVLLLIFSFIGFFTAYWISSMNGSFLFLGFIVVEFLLGVLYSALLSKHFITANGTLAFSHGLIPFLVATQLFRSGFDTKTLVVGGCIWLILFLTYNLKDLKDAEGDRFERTTLPSIFGVANANKINQFFLLVAIPLAVLVFFIANTSILSLGLTLFFGFFLCLLSNSLKKAHSKQDFVRILNLYRFLMALFLVSFAL